MNTQFTELNTRICRQRDKKCCKERQYIIIEVYFEYCYQFQYTMLYFNPTLVRLRQNVLYWYSFGYSLPDDGLVKAETCDRAVIIDEWLFLIGCAIGFIKYY